MEGGFDKEFNDDLVTFYSEGIKRADRLLYVGMCVALAAAVFAGLVLWVKP